MSVEAIFTQMSERLAEWEKVVRDQELAIQRLAAQNSAISVIFQMLTAALHVRGALDRDHIAVALEGAVQLLEKQKAPPEAVESVRTFQRGLLIQLPTTDPKPPQPH